MININDLDDSMFTLDGVSHYRKFFSNVKGDLVRVYNSFTAQNVLIDYIKFDQIILNGVIYPSAIALQTELLKVIYVSDPVGVVVGQDNKIKTVFVNYSGEPTSAVLASALNSSPTVTVGDKEVLLVVASNSGGTVFKYFVNGAGKGVYGVGGTQIQPINIQVVYSGQPDNGDIINNPTTQFINLGEIYSYPIETVVNTSPTPIVVQGQEEGYVVFKTLISGSEVNYLFLGEGGIYGGSYLQTTADDFQVLSDLTPIPNGQKEDSENKTNSLSDASSTIKFPTFSAVIRWFKERAVSYVITKDYLADLDSIFIGDSEDLQTTKRITWPSFKNLFKTIGGVSIFGSGNIDTTTAGLTNRIYFTGDDVTVSAGTFFASSATGKGSTASASPSNLVLGDNAKDYFTKDLLSIAQPAPTIGYAGNYSANVNFSQTPTPNATQSRFTIEVYRTNNGGTPIASGISGAPTGSLGVTVVAILDSGIITLTAGSVSNVPLTGVLTSNLILNTGERLRYHVSAQKVGAGGGNVTFTAYYGNTRNSFYDVPVAITTDSVINRSSIVGNTNTDVLNSLNTGKQVVDNQIPISANTPISNNWHGKTIIVSASCTLTVPNSLINELDFNVRTITGATITWAITSPFTWETTPNPTPEKTVGHFMRIGSTNTVILDAS